MPFTVLFALASFVLLLFRRLVFPKRSIREPPVVVKGHTYSDSVDDETIRSKRIHEVRRVCCLGTGGEADTSALTALVLADRNPNVQFDVVDRDARRVAAWNSDLVPANEPGLDALLFDDVLDVKNERYGQELHRKRRLSNVLFSTDVAGCVAGADVVFLFEGTELNTIRTIAQVSTGHKIIVHKGRANINAIRQKLDEAPTACFDVLLNPDFLIPGSMIYDLLNPSRVIIGNLPGKHSSEAVTLLLKLYAWIPLERIITTDVWSAELGRIATHALLAQQSATVHALGAICSRTHASGPQVSQIVAKEPRVAIRPVSSGVVDGDVLRADVDCLVYLAEQLGLSEVAEYWRCVMRVNNFMSGRVSEVAERTSGTGNSGKVAMLDVSSTEALVHRGIAVRIHDPRVARIEQSGFQVEDSRGIECSIAV